MQLILLWDRIIAVILKIPEKSFTQSKSPKMMSFWIPAVLYPGHTQPGYTTLRLPQAAAPIAATDRNLTPFNRSQIFIAHFFCLII